jgi:chromosome segregation ATPase
MANNINHTLDQIITLLNTNDNNNNQIHNYINQVRAAFTHLTQQNQGFQAEINANGVLLRTLQHNNQLLMNEKADLQNQNQNLNRTIENLRAEIVDLKGRNDNIIEEITRRILSTATSDIVKQIDQLLTTKLAQLKVDICAELNQLFRSLERSINAINVSIQNLKTNIDAINVTCRDINQQTLKKLDEMTKFLQVLNRIDSNTDQINRTLSDRVSKMLDKTYTSIEAVLRHLRELNVSNTTYLTNLQTYTRNTETNSNIILNNISMFNKNISNQIQNEFQILNQQIANITVGAGINPKYPRPPGKGIDVISIIVNKYFYVFIMFVALVIYFYTGYTNDSRDCV